MQRAVSNSTQQLTARLCHLHIRQKIRCRRWECLNHSYSHDGRGRLSTLLASDDPLPLKKYILVRTLRSWEEEEPMAFGKNFLTKSTVSEMLGDMIKEHVNPATDSCGFALHDVEELHLPHSNDLGSKIASHFMATFVPAFGDAVLDDGLGVFQDCIIEAVEGNWIFHPRSHYQDNGNFILMQNGRRPNKDTSYHKQAAWANLTRLLVPSINAPTMGIDAAVIIGIGPTALGSNARAFTFFLKEFFRELGPYFNDICTFEIFEQHYGLRQMLFHYPTSPRRGNRRQGRGRGRGGGRSLMTSSLSPNHPPIPILVIKSISIKAKLILLEACQEYERTNNRSYLPFLNSKLKVVPFPAEETDKQLLYSALQEMNNLFGTLDAASKPVPIESKILTLKPESSLWFRPWPDIAQEFLQGTQDIRYVIPVYDFFDPDPVAYRLIIQRTAATATLLQQILAGKIQGWESILGIHTRYIKPSAVTTTVPTPVPQLPSAGQSYALAVTAPPKRPIIVFDPKVIQKLRLEILQGPQPGSVTASPSIVSPPRNKKRSADASASRPVPQDQRQSLDSAMDTDEDPIVLQDTDDLILEFQQYEPPDDWTPPQDQSSINPSDCMLLHALQGLLLDHNLFSFNQYVNYCLFQESVQQQSGYANAHMAAKLKAFLQSHGLTLPLNV